MPINATMGLKKIFIAPAQEDGEMPANGTSWLDLGDVYKETCTLTDDDVETTKHESETSSKKIVLAGEYVTTIELTLMDPDLEQLSRYFGGTVSGTEGSQKWSRPLKPPYKEWAMWIQPEDGMFVGSPNVRIIPKFEITYNSKGICLCPMTISLQSTLDFSEGQTDPTVTGGA